MADTETEIVLDEPEVKVEVEGEKPRAETKPAVTTADEGVEDLKAQVARARAESDRRLSEANRQIEEVRRRAIAAENERDTVKKDAVSTVIDSLKQEKDSAKRDYRQALTDGDHDKAADAQERLSMAAARLVEAEKGKLELDATKPAPVAQPVQHIEDRVDRMARSAEANGGRRSAEWIRAHPEFARDESKWEDVEAAHYAALAKKIKVESNEYFEFVESELGIRPRREEPAREAREVSRAPTAAPVSRQSTQTPGAVRNGAIRLSAKDVSVAMETIGVLYPNASRDEILKKYAAQKQAGLAEGKISRGDW